MAVIREIKEELDAEIEVDSFICTVEYSYPNFHLIMHCYLCNLLDEAVELKEHLAAKWLKKSELDSPDWLAADIEIVEKLKEMEL